MINMIDSSDIQVKNVRDTSNPNNDNKIRKSWVMALPETTSKKIIESFKNKNAEPEEFFEFCQSIDKEVSDKWINHMKEYQKLSIENGAKKVFDKFGGERLENDYCVNADDQLIVAAQEVALELTKIY